MTASRYASALDPIRERCFQNGRVTLDGRAEVVFCNAESYECKTLVENPAVLDRVLMTHESDSIKELRSRIFQILNLAERVKHRDAPLPVDDDSACRNLLLFAWPEHGLVAFMGITNFELLRHRTASKDRPGFGHLKTFENLTLARESIEHLFTFYSRRDIRAWPVWGLSPTGNYWSVNGRSFRAAYRTE